MVTKGIENWPFKDKHFRVAGKPIRHLRFRRYGDEITKNRRFWLPQCR